MTNQLLEKTSIKSWAEDDRPREKLLIKGEASLSDAELIAILIGSGNREETAVDLCRRILKSCESLDDLARLSIHDLTQFRGIGEAKAISIKAALELGRRRKQSENKNRTQITSSKDVASIFLPLLEDLPHEEFWVLLMNRANKVMDKKMISRGGVSGTVADVRFIFKEGINRLASSIVLCHNHPSGNLKPSESDRKLTKKMVEVGRIMDMPVLDHIIVSCEGYFSFADEGMI